MPELPEVETVKLQLEKLLPGRTIENIQVIKAKSFKGNKANLRGKKISFLKRFAKMLYIGLSSGEGLLVHLKMTGQLIFRDDKINKTIINGELKVDENLKILPNRHTRVAIAFQDKAMLYFNDLRIFGWIKHINPVNENEELKRVISKLGPDPTKDFNGNILWKILKKTERPVKSVLMDQEKIAGIGNIYANDALFLSGISPLRKSSQISSKKADILCLNIRKVLFKGIKYGGASKTNFRDAMGLKGSFQDYFVVYGRKGEICPNSCGGIIKRIILGGRGTFYCPRCQR